MRQKDGTLKPGYNEGVATENEFVLDYDLSDTSGDSNKMVRILEGVEENIGKIPDSATADSAYGSEENYQYMEDRNIKANGLYQRSVVEIRELSS